MRQVVAGIVVYITAASCLSDPLLPEIFFPFGVDQGDTVANQSDDLGNGVTIDGYFPFCGNTTRNFQVNPDGILTVFRVVPSYSNTHFPIPSIGIVAAYWSDISTRVNNGRIYFRQTTDATLLTKASGAISSDLTAPGVAGFQARWLFIATWHNVTYYGGNSTTPTNSFQAVLITDWVHSFVVFNYGNMTWHSKSSADSPAQVGVNCPDGRTYQTAPSSGTPDVVNIGRQTNSTTRGRLAYRVDGVADQSAVPPICDIRVTGSCRNVSVTTANVMTNASCIVTVTKEDGSDTRYSASVQVSSPNTATCNLPPETFLLCDNNLVAPHGPGFDFYSLPYGCAMLTFVVSISNDGVRYNTTMKVVDGLCMTCNATGCTQKTGTCLIRGYCFAKFDRNPYNNSWTCQPDISPTLWSEDQKAKPQTPFEAVDSTNGDDNRVASIVAPSVLVPVIMILAVVTAVIIYIKMNNASSEGVYQRVTYGIQCCCKGRASSQS